MLAVELVSTLSTYTNDTAVRSLSAVMLRRELVSMLPKLTAECIQSIKQGLIQAAVQESEPSMRRKLCDTIGRLGSEFMSGDTNGWPELMTFIQGACNSSDTPALSYMAPALVQHSIWSTCGSHIQALLMAGLAAGIEAEITSAALGALTALLKACAELENTYEEKTIERRQMKAVAASLAASLPQMLGVVEQAVNSAEPRRLTEVLENLVEVGCAQPKLFKAVLPQVRPPLPASPRLVHGPLPTWASCTVPFHRVPASLLRFHRRPHRQVVEGMSFLAGQQLPIEARISCVELLLTIAEGAPKMVAKVRAPTPPLGMPPCRPLAAVGRPSALPPPPSTSPPTPPLPLYLSPRAALSPLHTHRSPTSRRACWRRSCRCSSV